MKMLRETKSGGLVELDCTCDVKNGTKPLIRPNKEDTLQVPQR